MRHFTILPPTGTLRHVKTHLFFWGSYSYCSIVIVILCFLCQASSRTVMLEYNTKILLLNVNGLNNPVKHQKVMTKLRRDKSQIIYLQETHLSKQESEKLNKFGHTKSFFSSFRHGCRRCVIIKEISDKEGRYILVRGKLENEMVTLVNVSAPPNSGELFF